VLKVIILGHYLLYCSINKNNNILKLKINSAQEVNWKKLIQHSKGKVIYMIAPHCNLSVLDYFPGWKRSIHFVYEGRDGEAV